MMTITKFSHLLFDLLKHKINSETINIQNGTPDGAHLCFLIELCICFRWKPRESIMGNL